MQVNGNSRQSPVSRDRYNRQRALLRIQIFAMSGGARAYRITGGDNPILKQWLHMRQCFVGTLRARVFVAINDFWGLLTASRNLDVQNLPA